MKCVYFEDPITPSKALSRVSLALYSWLYDKATNGAIVDEAGAANLVVVPVVGRRDHVQRQVDDLIAAGKQVAIIQYALRSTKNPNTSDWVKLWRRAQVVWSYYDLNKLCAVDGTKSGFNFYHAPLGVDAAFTKPLLQGIPKAWHCGSFARHWLTESHREIVLAAGACPIDSEQSVWHVGEPLRAHSQCAELGSLNDSELAAQYSLSRFAPGLRRTEGFELPAAEGLLCGCQPILFDTPIYRAWYDSLGCEFIPERDRAGVLKSLTKLFKRGPVAPSTANIKASAKRFNWDTICRGFWERALA